jgi:hypothetical protein
MKKPLFAVVMAFLHKQSFAAAVIAASGGVSAGAIAELAGLSPAMWIASTFGSVYVYLHHKDTPRSRLWNVVLSICFGVAGGDVSAGYVRDTYHVTSWFLAPLLALMIAMMWPWLFEKFLEKKVEK